jgi:PST family polysaccharide transporter
MAFRGVALGTAAMSCVSILRILAQFLVVPILSRILSPDDYGIVAMAMPFVLFTMVFSDAGLGQSLVRTSRKEMDVWSTSFWLTLIIGFSLAVLIALSAPLGAMFFEEPRLQPIILALSLVVLLQAGATIPEASLRQNHKFGTIAATEMSAVAAGIGSAVLIALNGGGAWALVAQQLVLYGTRFIMTFLFSRFRPSQMFNLGSVKEHLIFGRDVLNVNFFGFIISSMDSFIIGKVLGPALLGLYTMAFLFARLPARLVAGPLQYVIYAHLAPRGSDMPLIHQVFLFLTRALSILMFPAIGMVAAAYHPVFTIFLSDKWLKSGEIFMLVAPAVALQAVTALRNTFLMIIGRTDVMLRSTIEFCLVLAIALLSSVWFGIKWVAIGYGCAVFLYFPRSMTFLLPLIECSFSSYLKTMIVPLVVTATSIMSYFLLTHILPMSEWVKLFLGGGLSVLAIAISSFIQLRSLKSGVDLLR